MERSIYKFKKEKQKAGAEKIKSPYIIWLIQWTVIILS